MLPSVNDFAVALHADLDLIDNREAWAVVGAEGTTAVAALSGVTGW